MKSAEEMIRQYKMMEQVVPSSSMLREVRWQYADMSKGGDGGALWSDENGKEVTCREHNYPRYPDSFFQEVITGMGW